MKKQIHITAQINLSEKKAVLGAVGGLTGNSQVHLMWLIKCKTILLQERTANTVFIQAGMKFSSKILAISGVFSKYKVLVFLSRLHKYPTVDRNWDYLRILKWHDFQVFQGWAASKATKAGKKQERGKSMNL